MLGEDVESAWAEDLLIQRPFGDRIEGGSGLKIFEPIARDEDSFGRLVEPVVGAADPLEEARGALWRTHLDHEIDVAPVDTEIEAGRADEGAEAAARDRRFDLTTRFKGERTVMDANRQMLLVHRPKVLEDEFGERARVAEDERRPVTLDSRITFSAAHRPE
jgi:hypothetical protein